MIHGIAGTIRYNSPSEYSPINFTGNLYFSISHTASQSARAVINFDGQNFSLVNSQLFPNSNNTSYPKNVTTNVIQSLTSQNKLRRDSWSGSQWSLSSSYYSIAPNDFISHTRINNSRSVGMDAHSYGIHMISFASAVYSQVGQTFICASGWGESGLYAVSSNKIIVVGGIYNEMGELIFSGSQWTFNSSIADNFSSSDIYLNYHQGAARTDGKLFIQFTSIGNSNYISLFDKISNQYFSVGSWYLLPDNTIITPITDSYIGVSKLDSTSSDLFFILNYSNNQFTRVTTDYVVNSPYGLGDCCLLEET